METFVSELSVFFRWLMVSSVQVSVLVCLVFAIKTVVRNRLAIRWHYWLWLLLLVRMVMPAAPESSFSLFNLLQNENTTAIARKVLDTPLPAAKIVSSKSTQPVPVETGTPPKKIVPQIPGYLISPTAELSANNKAIDLELIDILALLWFIAATAMAIFAVFCNFRFWRIIKSRRPLTDGKILELFEECKSRMGINTIVGVVVTDKVKSPALFGTLRPRLLLPEGSLEKLSNEQLRYVFLHELAHLKRNDIYLGWLTVILQVLHWFNPLVWLAFARMRADRELACDALVLSTVNIDKSNDYGQTLIDLFKDFSQIQFVPSIAGILENKSQLKRRIKMITQFKTGSYKWTVLAAVVLGVLGVIGLTNAKATDAIVNKTPTVLAKEFVQSLVNEDFSTAVKNFDDTMKTAMPADKLEQTWKALTSQAGVFNKPLGVRTEKFLAADIVLVTCEFEKGPLDVKVVYNENKQIAGLFFLPTPQEVLKRYQAASAEAGDTYRIIFRPTGRFNPKTPTELLDAFNKAVGFKVKTHHFKTAVRDNKLYGYILTDSEAEQKAIEIMLKKSGKMEFVTAEQMTTDELANHYSMEQSDMKTPAGPRATQPKSKKTRPRDFVRVVIGRDKMTFEGDQLDDLERLGLLLPQVPDRKQTVLELAVTSMDIREGKDWDHTMAQLSSLANKYGFKYLSFTGEHPLGSYGISESRFSDRLRNFVTVDIEKGPNNTPLTVQYAVIGICKDAGIPYQWDKSAELADQQQRNFVEPVHIKDVTLEKALLDVLAPLDLRFDLDENGLYLYHPAKQRKSKTKAPGLAEKKASENLAANGWRLWGQRKLAEAEEIFKKAVEKDPTNDNAYQGLGWAQLNQGKKLNARDSFEKCVQINPENSAALNGLGWIAHGQGNKDEAISWWEKAVTANPTATASLNGLTQVYMERNDYNNAIKYYNMWLKAEPNNTQAKTGLKKATAGISRQ